MYRKNEIPNDHLSKQEYESYKKKFSVSLKQGITFSNQWKTYGELRRIREENNFTTTFFKAARIYANNQESKIYNSNPDSSSINCSSSSRSRRSSVNLEEFDNDQDLTSSSTSRSDGQNQITIDVDNYTTFSDSVSETNNAIISNLIETINVEIFEKYNLWKNAKFFETENNALKVENHALKYELSNLKTRYTDLEKDITNLKEKYIASSERKIILESQETEYKYTIKNLEDTIKDFEATINDLRNNELNLKKQYKELLRELTLLKNKNEESENRKNN
ncbi:46491_t:CDS:2 [Gigaspora margarita]|uniref:46491_t:CDS:1 n=1 Tax=Gigaspora margarita TaxID=4874 RepID=A0ABN7UL32_GIGMA|nr:46491_t:CDS:2 [Gigaspora margarita]